MAALELIAMGRVGVDLYPEQSGVPLAEVRTFARSLGGSAANVAVGTARLGHAAALITNVGEDGFGTYVRRALESFNVDTRWVGTDPELRTPLVFCELYPPDNFPLLFYREPKAPDMNLRLEELDLEAIRQVPIFWTTGTGLSDEPSRTATLGALGARAPGLITVHDLDYRPVFWRSEREARRAALAALEHATIAVGNRQEAAMAVGDAEPEELASRLLQLDLQLAIIKLGPDGVLVATGEHMERIPPVQVEVVNGLGAGDAFGAALCHGLLSAWDPVRMVRFANAAGAIVASRLACADAMPAAAEVNALLEGANAAG